MSLQEMIASLTQHLLSPAAATVASASPQHQPSGRLGANPALQAQNRVGMLALSQVRQAGSSSKIESAWPFVAGNDSQ